MKRRGTLGQAVTFSRILGLALVLVGQLIYADEFPPAYDGLQAGAEAHARSHARRLAEINQQISLIEKLKWYNGPHPLGCTCDACLSSFGLGRWFAYDERFFADPQPIGRIEIQTGPNRWESHPVYAAPRHHQIESPQPLAPSPEELPPPKPAR